MLFKIDDTSIQITNFLRGYVDNEINLNVHHSCDRSCSDYKTARQHGCYEGTFCDDNRKAGRKDTTCSGQIFDCTFVESDMQICLSVSKQSKLFNKLLIKSKICRVQTTPKEDTTTLSMILVDVLVENHVAHILS